MMIDKASSASSYSVLVIEQSGRPTVRRRQTGAHSVEYSGADCPLDDSISVQPRHVEHDLRDRVEHDYECIS